LQTTFGIQAKKDIFGSPNLTAPPQTPGLDLPLYWKYLDCGFGLRSDAQR